MRIMLLVALVSVILLSPFQTALAQSSGMPLPLGVVKDGDGKIVGQIADWSALSIVININGTHGIFQVLPSGLRDIFGSEWSSSAQRYFYHDNVLYSERDCEGETYVRQPGGNGVEIFYGVNFAVAGPDPVTGEYRVYRSTLTSSPYVYGKAILSAWYRGECYGFSSDITVDDLVPGVEVTPNPLAGFHGPTAANPERIWTIEGGTRLP